MAEVLFYALDENATIDDALFDVTTEDYKHTILQLLPFGLAWTPTPGGMFDKLLCALSLAPSRVERRGRDMIEEMDVRTTDELIDDWERVLGLPGECNDNPPITLEDRQEAAHAKLTGRDAINEGFFLDLASDLGYPGSTIVREHNPFQCGISDCGDELKGWQGHWTYTWTLILTVSTDNDAALQCQVRDNAQAHEVVHFVYPGQTYPGEQPSDFIIEAPN